jgi:hypothetical protein
VQDFNPPVKDSGSNDGADGIPGASGPSLLQPWPRLPSLGGGVRLQSRLPPPVQATSLFNIVGDNGCMKRNNDHLGRTAKPVAGCPTDRDSLLPMSIKEKERGVSTRRSAKFNTLPSLVHESQVAGPICLPCVDGWEDLFLSSCMTQSHDLAFAANQRVWDPMSYEVGTPSAL